MPTIPNRTFGVEIEIKGLDTYQAADALQRAGLVAEAQSYNHNRTNCWKVTTDGSLTGVACEVVSPVLRGEEGIADLRKACQALSQAGARVDRQCGLHVHVGATDLTANDAAMILSRYARFESIIDSWMPESRRADRNQFCRTMIPVVTRSIDGRSWANIPQVASQFGGPNDRYWKVNMQAFHRHRTIEFRQHSGTCNGSKIENWVRFLLHFVESSRNQNVTVEDRGDAYPVPQAPVYGRHNRRRNTAGLRRNSMDRKLDAVILAFRAAPNQRLSLSQIAAAGGWSLNSVPPYITRLRQERGCQLRKIRATGEYILIGNSGRLSSDSSPQAAPAPAVAVEAHRAARRVLGVAHIAQDSVFRGVPEEVVSYFEERAAELGEMNRNNEGGPRRR